MICILVVMGGWSHAADAGLQAEVREFVLFHRNPQPEADRGLQQILDRLHELEGRTDVKVTIRCLSALSLSAESPDSGDQGSGDPVVGDLVVGEQKLQEALAELRGYEEAAGVTRYEAVELFVNGRYVGGETAILEFLDREIGFPDSDQDGKTEDSVENLASPGESHGGWSNTILTNTVSGQGRYRSMVQDLRVDMPTVEVLDPSEVQPATASAGQFVTDAVSLRLVQVPAAQTGLARAGAGEPTGGGPIGGEEMVGRIHAPRRSWRDGLPGMDRRSLLLTALIGGSGLLLVGAGLRHVRGRKLAADTQGLDPHRSGSAGRLVR